MDEGVIVTDFTKVIANYLKKTHAKQLIVLCPRAADIFGSSASEREVCIAECFHRKSNRHGDVTKVHANKG